MNHSSSIIEKIQKTGHALSLAIVFLALILIIGCKTASRTYSGPDIYLRPYATSASVSFDGITQMGHDVHTLEVRRLVYKDKSTKEEEPSINSCVIYYAGEEYGPSILLQIPDCMDPLVKKVSSNLVEIYYLTGAHTHIRQRWKLLGSTAELEKQEAIQWDEDPRVTDAEKAKYR